MLTYRVRPRTFKFRKTTLPEFPTTAKVTFHFAPDQPFGCSPGGGRTAVRAKPARAYFDANSGQHYIESNEPLKPLDVTLDRTRLSGTTLEVRRDITDLVQLEEVVQSIYYILPLLLGIDFADPPLVRRVEGTLGDVPFSWELFDWIGEFRTTTQDQQENCFRVAWNRLYSIDAGTEQRRLVAALRYFHVATRLNRVGAAPGEFLAEALLNYSKILDVLYSPSTSAVRKELGAIGYGEEEIERDFIPAMILRSNIDVAHVSLTLFEPDQLETLHRYADRAETVFRLLLAKLLAELDAGTLRLPDYEVHAADTKTNGT